MSLLRYFKPLSQLPTANQTGLPAHAVTFVNNAVKRALDGEDTDHQACEAETKLHNNFYARGSCQDWRVCCAKWGGEGSSELQEAESK